MKSEKIIHPQKVYNVEEAAKILDINNHTLLDYLRNGKIVAQKIGEWKILGQNLIDFLSIKTYMIITKEGYSSNIEATSQADLNKKLSSGNYGVFPIRGKDMIRFTPDNIKEVVEIIDNK